MLWLPLSYLYVINRGTMALLEWSENNHCVQRSVGRGGPKKGARSFYYQEASTISLHWAERQEKAVAGEAFKPACSGQRGVCQTVRGRASKKKKKKRKLTTATRKAHLFLKIYATYSEYFSARYFSASRAAMQPEPISRVSP